MLFPGSLTDVGGLAVGHHTDTRRPTGCTVVLCPEGAVCGVDVRGAAPGTRETDLLRPDTHVAARWRQPTAAAVRAALLRAMGHAEATA